MLLCAGQFCCAGSEKQPQDFCWSFRDLAPPLRFPTPAPKTNSLFVLNCLSCYVHMIKLNRGAFKTCMFILKTSNIFHTICHALISHFLHGQVCESSSAIQTPWYIFHLRDKDIKSDTQSCVFFTVASHVQGDTFAYATPFLAPGNRAVAFEHSSFTWHALYSQDWRGAAALALMLYPHCFDQMLFVKGKFLSAGNRLWSGARDISHIRPVSSRIIVLQIFLPSIRRRHWSCLEMSYLRFLDIWAKFIWKN